MRPHLQQTVLIGLLSCILAACSGKRSNSLGIKEGFLTACPESFNCVSSQANDEKHRIAGLAFSGDPNTAFAHLKMILSRRNDTVIIKEFPDYLRVEFHTVFFVDDGEFLLNRAKNIIHLRSASQLGYFDFGKNRSRIEEIRNEFSREVDKP